MRKMSGTLRAVSVGAALWILCGAMLAQESRGSSATGGGSTAHERSAEMVSELLREFRPPPVEAQKAPVDPPARRGHPANAPAADATALGLQLARLGPEAVPALFDALAQRSQAGPARDPMRPPETVQELQREALISALCAQPAPLVHTLLGARVGRGATLGARCAALDLLSRCGGSRDIELVASIARGTEEAAEIEAPVAAAFQRALADILRRDRGGYGRLSTLMHGLGRELGAAAARAVADAGSREGLVFLARALDREPDLALALLAEIGRMGIHAERPIDPEVLAGVRARISDPSSPVLGEALLATGWLDDFDSIPSLIRYLRDHRAGVRADALWSLQRMSGLRVAAEPDVWTAWWEAESKWWRDDAPRLFRDLAAGNSARVKAALIACAAVRTYRHAIAAEIVPLFGSPDLEIARLAARISGQIASPVAVPALVDCLDRGDKSLRQSSWSALKAITAQSLPADAGAWRAAFPPH
jgi:hypothetical protein